MCFTLPPGDGGHHPREQQPSWDREPPAERGGGEGRQGRPVPFTRGTSAGWPTTSLLAIREIHPSWFKPQGVRFCLKSPGVILRDTEKERQARLHSVRPAVSGGGSVSKE